VAGLAGLGPQRDAVTGPRDVRIGTAGWSIPRAVADRFAPAGGTHLQRYARHFRCAEINSSFYRRHAARTYARWHDSTPPDFRFAVKLPRTITHEQKLRDAREPLAAFLGDIEGLGPKCGPVLVQLPPSHAFDAPVVTGFLALLRDLYAGVVVCEPRHATWFTPDADALLARYRIARVAADPAVVPAAAVPSAWRTVAYFRLHGSPRMYWSRYDGPFLQMLEAALLDSAAREVWCVFDNTASGAAIENAWDLSARLAAHPSSASSDGP